VAHGERLPALTDDLAIMANFGWQDWSQFGSVDVSLQNRPCQTGQFFHESEHEKYLSRRPWRAVSNRQTLALSLGFAYDSSPMSEANRSPSLPLDRNWRGAQAFNTIGAKT